MRSIHDIFGLGFGFWIAPAEMKKSFSSRNCARITTFFFICFICENQDNLLTFWPKIWAMESAFVEELLQSWVISHLLIMRRCLIYFLFTPMPSIWQEHSFFFNYLIWNGYNPLSKLSHIKNNFFLTVP